jgi:hypothetical protein
MGRSLRSVSRRVLPAAGGRGLLVTLARSPGAWLVYIDRGVRLQYRIDEASCLCDVVLAGEQGSVTRHRISEHPLVNLGRPKQLSAAPASAGVGMTPAKVPETPEPASSVMIRSTVDAPMGGTTVGGPYGFDASAPRLISPLTSA